MAIEIHEGDLPAGLDFGGAVAVDTETMGLNPRRDRLCRGPVERGRRRGTSGALPRTAPTTLPEPRTDSSKTARSPRSSILPVSTSPCFERYLGIRDGTGLLHQDRFKDRSHLYRPPFAEGSRGRVDRCRDLQGTAVLGLGSGNPDGGAMQICCGGCPSSARDPRGSGRDAGTRGAVRTCPTLLRFRRAQSRPGPRAAGARWMSSPIEAGDAAPRGFGSAARSVGNRLRCNIGISRRTAAGDSVCRDTLWPR